MRKIILLLASLATLSGCSSHAPTMQEVRSYCRSLSTESTCDSQGSICEEYSKVLLKSYASASECRKSCEEVQMKSQSRMGEQNCLPLFDAVETKCTEFCDGNYN